MSGTWTIFFFCPRGAGHYAVRSDGVMIILRTLVLNVIRYKTQVGRTERGFDWLGVWFDATGPTGIAPRAKENHRARRLRLEEQARRRGLSEVAVQHRVQQYEARWLLWAERQMTAALPDRLTKEEIVCSHETDHKFRPVTRYVHRLRSGK